jgi:hypothetical protein
VTDASVWLDRHPARKLRRSQARSQGSVAGTVGVFRPARRGACPCGGWGQHFSRAGETVARRRTRCSDPLPTLFIRWDRCHKAHRFSAIRVRSLQRSSPGLASCRRKRRIRHHPPANIDIQRARRGACPDGGWGSAFFRAGETVARSTDTARTHCSGAPGFSVLACESAFLAGGRNGSTFDRHPSAHAAAAILVSACPPPTLSHRCSGLRAQTDASVTIRPLVLTPAQWVSHI